jgi:hypothetical protein
MKKTLLVILVAVLFPLAAVAQETCQRHAEPKGGFSFCPPEGWAIKEDPKLEYKILIGPPSDDFAPNLIVTELKNFPLWLKDMVSVLTKESAEETAKRFGASEVGPLNQSEFITSSNNQESNSRLRR